MEYITRSKSEIRGTSKVDDCMSQAHHINKKIDDSSCSASLCSLQMTGVPPQYTHMTDLVESQGGFISANQDTKPSWCVLKC